MQNEIIGILLKADTMNSNTWEHFQFLIFFFCSKRLCCMQYISNRKFPHAQNPSSWFRHFALNLPIFRNQIRTLKCKKLCLLTARLQCTKRNKERESLTHFPDHRRCLIIPRTEVKLLFHLSNEPCVTFQWMVSTWRFTCAGKRRWALVYGSSATQKKKRDEHRSVPVDSVFSRVLTGCWCGACAVKLTDLSTDCHCALLPRVLKLNRSATEL